MAILNGTPGNDKLFGTAFDDILNLDGDLLSYPGTGGDDTVFGYEGNDQIYGGAGNDVLIGGADNDRLTGGVGIDQLSGGSGQDQLYGGTDDDYLFGGGGNDLLDGGAGADRMYGGAGSDTYYVDNVGDVAEEVTDDTLGGYDTVFSSVTHTLGFGIENLFMTGSAAINGTGNANGNNLFGNEANNVLSGLDGGDVIVGGGGNDQLLGGNGNDGLAGGNGNDVLNGGGGNDVLDGGTGVDNASYSGAVAGVRVNLGLTAAQNTVGAGSDQLVNIENLTGSSFNDSLTGNSGNNVLTGGAGNDTLTGGSGNDTLIGGTGKDQLNGGAGNDRFDFNAASESPTGTGRDVITGFAGAGTALGDQIDLRDIDANVLVSGNQAFIFGGSFTAGHLRYVGGVLQGNTDGDAAAEFEIQLVGTPGLSIGGTGTDILL